MPLPRAPALLLLAAGAACRAPRKPDPGPPAPTAQAFEQAAAERALRRMFPGIEGEITREGIAQELDREKAELDTSAGVRAAARQAIEVGEFDRARDLLGELLAGAHVERARDLAAQGDAVGALAAFDAALEAAPRSAAILCARGEAALAVATPAGDTAVLESALANFLDVARRDPGAAGAGPRARPARVARREPGGARPRPARAGARLRAQRRRGPDPRARRRPALRRAAAAHAGRGELRRLLGRGARGARRRRCCARARASRATRWWTSSGGRRRTPGRGSAWRSSRARRARRASRATSRCARWRSPPTTRH
jgi:tetratricopeptide (TPR) repeat protein